MMAQLSGNQNVSFPLTPPVTPNPPQSQFSLIPITFSLSDSITVLIPLSSALYPEPLCQPPTLVFYTQHVLTVPV